MVERIVGFMPKPQLMKRLEPHLAAAPPARRLDTTSSERSRLLTR